MAPSLSSLTPKPGETLWKIRLRGPRSFLAGLTSGTSGGVFSPATRPRALPSCHSAWLKRSACCSCPSALFFSHLVLLRLIALGFVSARCVRTHFLFSSFVWLEFNYTLGTEIPDSKYCLFAFSSIYTGTRDIFLGELCFFFLSFFPRK